MLTCPTAPTNSAASHNRPHDNITRICPIPADYVPPSLPMLSDPRPFRPGAVDPMISGGDLPGASFDDEVLTQWRPKLAPDTAPVEPPNSVMDREYSLGPEHDPFYEVTEENMNPTRPPLDKPDMPSFMCCRDVKYVTKEHTNVGSDQLRELFTQFGHYYPVDWSWIAPEDEDFAAAWNHHRQGYIGVVDLSTVTEKDDSKFKFP